MGLFGIGIVSVSHRGNVLNGDFFFCPLVSEGFSISMAVLWVLLESDRGPHTWFLERVSFISSP